MDAKTFQTLVTAGLLHDIGKFLQRGDFGPLAVTGKHPEVSRDFILAHRAFAYSGVSGRRVRKHPDTKPATSGQ